MNEMSILAMSMEKMKQAHLKFDLLNKPFEMDHFDDPSLLVVIVDSDENGVPMIKETYEFRRLLLIEKELKIIKDQMKKLIIEKNKIVKFLK